MRVLPLNFLFFSHRSRLAAGSGRGCDFKSTNTTSKQESKEASQNRPTQQASKKQASKQQ
jgi:hypothetical protein